MKKLFLIVFALMSLQHISAQKIIKNVGDFTTLRAFDKIPITLISSSEGKVEISGTKKDDVQVINKNGELKIRMTTLKLLNGDDVNVKVYYKDLNDIQVSEGAIVKGADRLEAGLLYLNAKEGAKIMIDVEVGKINAKVNSGGEVKLSGEAEDQDIVITSGGKYDAGNVESNKVVVAINAGGSAVVNASDLVEAKTRAGGNIDIYGGAEVSQKTIAGGTINIH